MTLDEKLIYFLALFIPHEALGYLDDDPEVAIAGLVKRIQVSLTLHTSVSISLPLTSSDASL